MPLSPSQFDKLIDNGFSVEEIASFEKRNNSESTLANNTRPINPTGLTSSPQDFLPQEMANIKQPNIRPSLQGYMSQAQPAFKLALEHPETLLGQTISPDAIAQSTSGEYSDIYRRAAMPLPGANSTNIGGQMIPQLAGGAIDIASRPSSVIIAGTAKYASPMVGKLASTSPAFRRFLQLRVPTFSAKILEDNPMAPVYKTIQGVPRDISKPLPPNSPKLVKQGQKLVDAVHETMDNLGNQYGKTLEPFYANKATISGISKEQLKAIGLNSKTATVEDLWKTRWDLLKKVGNPWRKEELLKKTTLKEDELVSVIDKLKANVLNNIDDTSRKAIERLDPQFSEAIKSGKGILSSVYNPETGRINTVRLTNIFKNKADAGTQDLFNKFGQYDKRVNEVAGAIKNYNRFETAKKIGGIGILGTGAEQFLRWRQRQVMEQILGSNNR